MQGQRAVPRFCGGSSAALEGHAAKLEVLRLEACHRSCTIDESLHRNVVSLQIRYQDLVYCGFRQSDCLGAHWRKHFNITSLDLHLVRTTSLDLPSFCIARTHIA